MENRTKKYKKVFEGIVVSTKMNKSIVVRVESRQKHPLYGKTISKNKRFKAHDEKNECSVGDIVRIIECRPISKEKCFRLLSIVKRIENIEGDVIEDSVQSVLKREKNVPNQTSTSVVVEE